MALALAAVVVFSACGASGDGDKAPKGEFGLQQLNVASPDKDQYVMIETDRGNIKIVLFKETPLHRANFINLVMNNSIFGYKMVNSLTI